MRRDELQFFANKIFRRNNSKTSAGCQEIITPPALRECCGAAGERIQEKRKIFLKEASPTGRNFLEFLKLVSFNTLGEYCKKKICKRKVIEKVSILLKIPAGKEMKQAEMLSVPEKFLYRPDISDADAADASGRTRGSHLFRRRNNFRRRDSASR